jgi:hypothetical protein
MTTTREVKVMALHRFDWTRKGAANARDYRHDLYPDGDFEYGEEDLPPSSFKPSSVSHADRKGNGNRVRRRRLGYRFWTRPEEPDWESLPSAKQRDMVAWSLNQNELATLKYLSVYGDTRGTSFITSTYIVRPCYWEVTFEKPRDERLIECGYAEETASTKAGVYAMRLFQLGLVDKKSGGVLGFNSLFRINENGAWALTERGQDVRRGTARL